MPETTNIDRPLTYLIGFTLRGFVGAVRMDFPLPVTEEDLPGIVRTLADGGYPNAVILAVSLLAPRRQ